MLRYVFAWAPAVVVVGTAVILPSAYLALMVLMLAAAVVLATGRGQSSRHPTCSSVACTAGGHGYQLATNRR